MLLLLQITSSVQTNRAANRDYGTVHERNILFARDELDDQQTIDGLWNLLTEQLNGIGGDCAKVMRLWMKVSNQS